MVLFNYALKELTAKIVYYGPGLSGKTTNLQYIYEELPIKNKGRMLTLATETDRTLYFDFLPVDAGVVRGVRTRVQLYTVPGQVFYNATRRMVLKGSDGVVFVADSQKNMMEANLESIENLRENLEAHDLKLAEIPLVLQFNKRDLEGTTSIEEMNDRLNPMNVPFYEAVATSGIGVEDTLQAISGLVLKNVIERYGGERSSGMRRGGRDPATTDPARTDPGRNDLATTDPARLDPGDLVAAAASRSSSAERVLSETTGSVSGLGGGTGGDRFDDLRAPASIWSSEAEDESVTSENESADSHDGFNIDGILDEALRLDESDVKRTFPPAPAPARPDDGEGFAGLLDEALSESEAGMFLEVSPAEEMTPGEPLPVESESDEIVIDLEGEPPKLVEESGVPGTHLSELIKTRVSIPTEKLVSTPTYEDPTPVPERIEVPVTLHVDKDVEEQDIELVLKIRLRRKG